MRLPRDNWRTQESRSSSPPSPHDRACLSLRLVVNIGPPLTYFTSPRPSSRPPPSHANTNARLSVSTFRSLRSSSQQSTKILSDVGSRRPLTRTGTLLPSRQRACFPRQGQLLNQDSRKSKVVAGKIYLKNGFRNIVFPVSAASVFLRRGQLHSNS